jgi:Fic family protein
MSSFSPGYLERQPITQGLLRVIRSIGEFRGREALYREQSPQVLENLRQAAIIQSTEASNRLEGVVAPLDRIKDLIADRTTPRNRSEQEISGYRQVLATIHTRYAHIPFTPGVVLQLHRDLYQYTTTEGGRWKPVDNEITRIEPDGTRIRLFAPVPAHATPEAMESLHERFNRALHSGNYEPLLLIPAYVLDFLCIHPFLDGNGRMARLLSLLLLYQAGFEVGRFISIEMIVEQTRDGYYDTLSACSQGWHEAQHPILPWWEYFLGVMLLTAYRELERRVGLVSTAKGAKTSMVLDVLKNLPNEFSVKDLRERCPTVGIDLIRRILKQEREAGRLECLGRGPEARWQKLVEEGTVPTN